jgi:preprotein translocase subunit SecG
MLSLLLIILDMIVCASLIGVVLMQRSEGGAFGMGGGPTGLITTRGAGDLLTRTTWILFAAFLTISLALTLLGAHDRTNSAIIDKLKLQRANTSELNQQVAPPPASAPAPNVPAGSLLAPPPQSPLSAPAPQPIGATPQSLLAPQPEAKPKPAHAAAPKAVSEAAPPVLEAPKPAPVAPAKPASDAPASGAP